LDGDGIVANRQTDQELALRVGCNPDGGPCGFSASAGFHLGTFQTMAVLVRHAARNHNTGWHNQIAKVAGIARRQQKRLASQGQFVGR
jgi:hypothetical protein